MSKWIATPNRHFCAAAWSYATTGQMGTDILNDNQAVLRGKIKVEKTRRYGIEPIRFSGEKPHKKPGYFDVNVPWTNTNV